MLQQMVLANYSAVPGVTHLVECSMLRTRLVSAAEYWEAHRKTGSIYFIRNRREDTIKIGHSRDVRRRMQELQVGNSARLQLIGAVAASISIEPIIHHQLMEGHIAGEWFWDREVTTAWLMNMTQNEPLYRQIWELVSDRPRRLVDWSDPSKPPRRWNPDTKDWEPLDQ